jgi:hypothetical protein
MSTVQRQPSERLLGRCHVRAVDSSEHRHNPREGTPMISDALRTDIETWASRKDDRALFRMAKNGTLTKAMVTKYIANVTWMIRNTQKHLRTARDRARSSGNQALTAYFSEKVREEAGHDAWGDADLVSLTKMVSAPAMVPTPSIEALDAYVAKVIDENAVLYLPYIAFAEYITVLLGPELLTYIEERCGVPRTAMTIIDKHVELDREHAEEAFGVIGDLVGDPRMLAPLRRALAEMLRHFDGFCEDVTMISGAIDESEHEHVSAA